MTITMVRRLAVAALSVGATVCASTAFGPTVEAAPNASSPFAGKYTGPVPDASSVGDWGSISISSSGGIVFSQPPAGVDGWKFSGSVNADGTFTVDGKVTFHGTYVDDVRPAPAGTSYAADRSPEVDAANPGVGTTLYTRSTGTMSRGSDGNLYGTTDRGNSFLWVRK